MFTTIRIDCVEAHCKPAYVWYYNWKDALDFIGKVNIIYKRIAIRNDNGIIYVDMW